MRLGAVRGQHQRLLCSCLGSAYLCEPVVGRVRHVDFPHVGVGEANQCVDVVLVELQRRLEKTAGTPCRLERQITVPGSPPEKGVIDRVETVGTLTRRTAAFRRDHLYVDGAGQSSRNLVLHVEEIGALLVEAFGPQMPSALGIDELRVEPHSPGCVLHAPLENIPHAQLVADLADVDWLVLISKSGAARDHKDQDCARDR
jgi:hypothetical protein